MEFLELNENSIHFIKYFKDFEELAFLTVPYLNEGNIAVSGGSTYKKLFSYWVKYKDGIKNAKYFPVDERAVPFDSEDSNWGVAYKNFLSVIGRDEDKENFAESKEVYEELLKRKIGNNLVFDCIFLGVGEDGHTASLFPDSLEIDDFDSAVLETKSPKAPVERVSLGFSVLSLAKHIFLIIAGKNKAAVYKKILSNDESLPIVKLLNSCNNVIILVDREIVDAA